MYSSERVSWWKERTLDKTHQEAYDRVAERIPKKGKRFLDIGCGTGEILKRVWQNTRYQLYIGADATPEMIKLARENFENSGIEAKVVSRPALHIPKHSGRKMLLIYDDLMNSKIPLSFADTAVFIFPEILTDVGEPLAQKIKQLSFEELLAFKEKIVYPGLIRRLKIGGTLVNLEYDVAYKEHKEEREKDILEKLKNLYQFRGLKLESHEFFESPEVWRDTEGELLEGEIPGYRIFVSTRVR